jgi:fatty acyl-CoA reductase
MVGRSAAFFDVDGTLSATNSTTSLIWLRSRQHSPWRHNLWLASLIWRAPMALLADKLSRDLADRLVFDQFRGLSLARLIEDADDCCRALLLPACFPEALAEIELHQSAGRKVVLVSGGLESVLRPLADRLGVDLIARRLEAEGDRLTGAYGNFPLLDSLAKPPRQALGKAHAIRRHAELAGIDLSASPAYGDSLNDVEMLRLVGHPVAVNPDAALVRTARSGGWPVRYWRPKPSAPS